MQNASLFLKHLLLARKNVVVCVYRYPKGDHRHQIRLSPFAAFCSAPVRALARKFRPTLLPPSSRQIRESVGLSTRTSDADLIAASARAAELQRDVVVLRKVLATAGRAQLKDAAGEGAGRAAHSSVMHAAASAHSLFAAAPASAARTGSPPHPPGCSWFRVAALRRHLCPLFCGPPASSQKRARNRRRCSCRWPSAWRPPMRPRHRTTRRRRSFRARTRTWTRSCRRSWSRRTTRCGCARPTVARL